MTKKFKKGLILKIKFLTPNDYFFIFDANIYHFKFLIALIILISNQIPMTKVPSPKFQVPNPKFFACPFLLLGLGAFFRSIRN